MLSVGDKFPAFDLKAVVSIDPRKAFSQINQSSDEGKWKVVFFWPKDFTFVCPTEIAGFAKLEREFRDRDDALELPERGAHDRRTLSRQSLQRIGPITPDGGKVAAC